MRRHLYQIFVISLLLGSGSCTKPIQKVENNSDSTTLSQDQDQIKQKELDQKENLSRDVRESLYFIASLERESLRLILKNSTFEKTTLFSVLSYIFETQAGTKKSAPFGVDCNLYRLEKKLKNGFKIFKTCQKPEILLAQIDADLGGSESFQSYRVEFNVKEWSKIIGFSASLSAQPIHCRWVFKDKKVRTVECDNWVFTTNTTTISSEEVRLKVFQFNRDKEQQLRLVGGLFVDLVERRKIEVLVPLQGRIKLIEKEIEVKDDFADYLKQEKEKHGEKESNQKSNEEKEYEKLIQAESQNQSQNESQSQDQTSGASEIPPEDGFQDSQNGGVPQPKNRGR